MQMACLLEIAHSLDPACSWYMTQLEALKSEAVQSATGDVVAKQAGQKPQSEGDACALNGDVALYGIFTLCRISR